MRKPQKLPERYAAAVAVVFLLGCIANLIARDWIESFDNALYAAIFAVWWHITFLNRKTEERIQYMLQNPEEFVNLEKLQ